MFWSWRLRWVQVVLTTDRRSAFSYFALGCVLLTVSHHLYFVAWAPCCCWQPRLYPYDMSQGCSLGPSGSAGPMNRAYRTSANLILTSGGRILPNIPKFGKTLWQDQWILHNSLIKARPRNLTNFYPPCQNLGQSCQVILYSLFRHTKKLIGIPESKRIQVNPDSLISM